MTNGFGTLSDYAGKENERGNSQMNGDLATEYECVSRSETQPFPLSSSILDPFFFFILFAHHASPGIEQGHSPHSSVGIEG